MGALLGCLAVASLSGRDAPPCSQSIAALHPMPFHYHQCRKHSIITEVRPAAFRSSPVLASAFHPHSDLDASSMEVLHNVHAKHSELQVKDTQGCLPRRQMLLISQQQKGESLLLGCSDDQYSVCSVSCFQKHSIIYIRQQQGIQTVRRGRGTAGRMHPLKPSILRRAQRSSPFRLRSIDSWTSSSTLCTPTRCVAAAAFMAFTRVSHKAPIPIRLCEQALIMSALSGLPPDKDNRHRGAGASEPWLPVWCCRRSSFGSSSPMQQTPWTRSGSCP